MRRVIVGCGNVHRRDDGAGVVAIRHLQQWLAAHPRPSTLAVDAGTTGIEVLLQIRGASALTLIDACVSQAEPGTIFTLNGSELPQEPPPLFSLHQFRWNHALAAGGRIFPSEFPGDITVYLIETADTSFGVGLTPLVERAVSRVCRTIQEHLVA